MLGPPAHLHLMPAGLECLRRGSLEVLADDQQLSPGIERDQITSGCARVRDVDDPPALHNEPVAPLAGLEQARLLGPNREPLAIALDHVRHAYEARHERRLRALVDLLGGPDLLDPALA